MEFLKKAIEKEKQQGLYNKPAKYIAPMSDEQKIMRAYKKQVIDKPKHLEMEEIVKELQKQGKGKVVEMKKVVEPVMKAKKSMVVEGSIPIKQASGIDISSKKLYFSQGASGGSNSSMSRGKQISELMKKYKISLGEASKRLKSGNL